MRFQAMCTGIGILTAAIVVVGLLVVKALYDGVHDLVDVLQLRRLLSFMCSCYFTPQAPTIQGTRSVNCGVEQLPRKYQASATGVCSALSAAFGGSSGAFIGSWAKVTVIELSTVFNQCVERILTYCWVCDFIVRVSFHCRRW